MRRPTTPTAPLDGQNLFLVQFYASIPESMEEALQLFAGYQHFAAHDRVEFRLNIAELLVRMNPKLSKRLVEMPSDLLDGGIEVIFCDRWSHGQWLLWPL